MKNPPRNHWIPRILVNRMSAIWNAIYGHPLVPSVHLMDCFRKSWTNRSYIASIARIIFLKQASKTIPLQDALLLHLHFHTEMSLLWPHGNPKMHNKKYIKKRTWIITLSEKLRENLYSKHCPSYLEEKEH